jgi:glycosyltransferase involved in cell wall biosynthesis
LPVVASDIPANREWIADGQSGWVFPGGNSEALSKVLIKAAESEQNRQEVALRGRAIALARADARRNFPRLLARIEALAKAPRPQPH